MRGEFSIARGASGTVMRHFVRARAFAAPAPVAPLALGMTVPPAPRVLIPASRPAQRFTPSEAAAARPAVVLAPVTARADEHLARRHRAQRNSRASSIVPPGGEGWTIRNYRAILHSEPYASAGSGRSLGRDRQVSAVRGCVGLLADSDLTPTHERRHRRYARRAPPLAGSIGSGGKPRHVPGGRGGPIQRWFASTGTVSSRGLFAIYPRIFTATNTCETTNPEHSADRYWRALARPPILAACRGPYPPMSRLPVTPAFSHFLSSRISRLSPDAVLHKPYQPIPRDRVEVRADRASTIQLTFRFSIPYASASSTSCAPRPGRNP